MKTGVQRAGPRAGSSLIEVMVAALILAALAIAGAAVLHQARAGHYDQRGRRVAMEVATSRLEALRATPYPQIAPPTEDDAVHYLSRPGGVWTHSASDPGETVTLNHRELEIVTTVRYGDVDAGESDSYDYLLAEVSVSYGKHGANWVRLETRISP